MNLGGDSAHELTQADFSRCPEAVGNFVDTFLAIHQQPLLAEEDPTATFPAAEAQDWIDRAEMAIADRRQLVLPVATTIFAGRYGVIIRYGGTVDYRPTSQAIEAETYGRQDTGNGSGQGWDERAFSAQVAEWAIAVAGETGASVAHSAGSLRRGVGG